jgi:hypothetical protein
VVRSRAPARARFSFVPGGSPSPGSPVGIPCYPTLGNRVLASSSAKTNAAPARHCSIARRSRANFGTRSGSSSLAPPFARCHAQPHSWRPGRLVSAATGIPRRPCSSTVNVAQRPRGRPHPNRRGAGLRSASPARFSAGGGVAAVVAVAPARFRQRRCAGQLGMLEECATRGSVHKKGLPPLRSGAGPQRTGAAAGALRGPHTGRGVIPPACGLALPGQSPLS